MYRKKFTISIFICLLTLALCMNHSFAQDKIVAKFAHTAASISAMGKVCAEFAQRVNDRTEQLVIEVYPDGQLGGDKTIVEGAQLGTVHLCNVGYGLLASFVPEFGALELPYMYGVEPDISVFLEIAKTDLFKEWQEMLSDKFGIIVLAPTWYYGHRDMLVKTPVHTPDDLKGIKMRVVPANLYVETMRALGAIPTPIDWPEIYLALSQGVIDGVDTTAGAFYYNKFCEIAKYYVPSKHIFGINAMVGNKKFYDNIPEDDRKILDEELVWFQKEMVKKVGQEEIDSIELLRSVGVTITEIDRDLFRERIEEEQVAEKIAEKENWRPDTLGRLQKILADIMNE